MNKENTIDVIDQSSLVEAFIQTIEENIDENYRVEFLFSVLDTYCYRNNINIERVVREYADAFAMIHSFCLEGLKKND